MSDDRKQSRTEAAESTDWDDLLNRDISDQMTRADIRSLLTLSDIAFRQKLWLFGLFLLILLPMLLTPLQLSPFIGLLFLMMFAVSWDVVSGYTGQMSFGHAMFFAVGGYGATIFNIQHGLSPLLSIPLAAILAGLLGFLVGLPALRLRGPYLALVTLIVPIILLNITQLWADEMVFGVAGFRIPIAPDGFGGIAGLTPPDSLFGLGPSAVVTVPSYPAQTIITYYFALFLLVTMVGSMSLMMKTNIGDIFTAIREDEVVVNACGINATKFKLFSFTLSGLLGGFAAAVFVHTLAGAAQPAQILSLELSINVIIYSVLGGMGTIIGPVLGVVFFESIIRVAGMTGVTVFGKSLDDLLLILIYVLIVVVLIKRPRGLYYAVIKTSRRLYGRMRGENVREGTMFNEPNTSTAFQRYWENLKELARKYGFR